MYVKKFALEFETRSKYALNVVDDQARPEGAVSQLAAAASEGECLASRSFQAVLL